MNDKLKKGLIVIGVLTAVFVGGLLLNDQGEIVYPTREIDGKTVVFNLTDDNTNEDLPIYVAAERFKGDDELIVPFAVVNTTAQDQNITIQTYFQNSKRKIKKISRITDIRLNEETHTEDILEIVGCPNNCHNEVIGQREVTTYTNQRDKATLKQPIPKPENGKQASGEHTDKAGEFLISAQETAFYEMVIKLNPDKENSFKPEKFDIEVIGDRGGYGQLDPVISYTSVATGADNDGGNATTIATTAGLNTAIGDLIVVGTRNYNFASQVVSTITDTAGNTYSKATSTDSSALDRTEIWYTKATASHSNNIITVTFTSNTQYRNVIATKYTGAADSPLDTTAISTTQTTNTVTSNSFTTSQAEEVIVSFAQAASTASNWTAGGSSTERAETTYGVTMQQDWIVSSIQTGQTVSASHGSAATKTIIVATFKGTATPAASTGRRILIIE